MRSATKEREIEMASINVTKRGSTWQYRFEGAKVDGKRRQFSKSGFRTKKDALEAGTKALAEYNNGGMHFQPSDVSVADYLMFWLRDGALASHKETTVRTYESQITKRIIPVIGQYRLSSLSPSILSEFVNGMKTQGYSKSTVTVAKAALSSALDYAVEPLRYIKDNPMRYVKTPKIEKEKRERESLTDYDWKRILERFPEGNRFYVPLMVGYHAGLRIAEAYALTWDDIDFDNDTINVNKQIVYIKNKQWKFSYPKQSSSRLVKMGETLKGVLLKEKERQDKHEAEYGEFYYRIYLKDGHIVSNQEELPYERVNQIFRKDDGHFSNYHSFAYCSRVVSNDLGIKFDYHTLRHTHGTILFENGANIKAIQTRLGHRDIKTTLQIYVHTTKGMEQDAVDIFEKAVHA